MTPDAAPPTDDGASVPTRRGLRAQTGPTVVPAATTVTIEATDAAPVAVGTDAAPPAPVTNDAPAPLVAAESWPPVAGWTPAPAAADPDGAGPAVDTPAPEDPAPRDSAPADPAPDPVPAQAPEAAASAVATTRPAGARPKRSARPRRIALAWFDASTLTRGPAPTDLSAATAAGAAPVAPALLGRAPLRSPFRPGVLIPIATIALLVGAYAATTILWPLHAVAPTISAIQVDSAPAPPATPAWPAQGSAAVSVAGIDGTLASTDAAAPIASITKVVTALLVLDAMPLELGEQGPEYRFTSRDQTNYWSYLSRGESALPVPVGGTLTQYQLLEGMLIGSANNYADRLASDLWPTDAVFASAANAWLTAHGVPGITIVEPTGFDDRNAASPASLIPLAQKALANPVIAEIVAKTSTELPGAGHVDNTNALLADPGVIGVKTGSLDAYNLLAAKNVTIGDTTVRLYADVLGQPTDDERFAATRALFAELEAELQTEPSVPARTTAAIVSTVWGEQVEAKTDADAAVILYNGGAGTVTTRLDLGDQRERGDVVGTLTVTGPLDTSTVDLELTRDIEPPSILWRLTHPLQLFGLAD